MIAAVEWPSLIASDAVQRLIALAIAEDIGPGDVTTDSVFTGARATRAKVVARGPTVACGVPLAIALFDRFGATATATVAEGAAVQTGATLLEVEGDVRAILSGERLVLNFMQRLCGIAAGARRAADAVPPDCRARIFDTRKTTPGWRTLEKAAVRTGGAENHRLGLFDAVLIKDNHIAAAGSVKTAIERARRGTEGMTIEVEIDGLHQLDEALSGEPDIILLDNFTTGQMREAVRRVDGRCELEASGGVTVASIPDIARTGVDRISMGALTHTIIPADLGLDV